LKPVSNNKTSNGSGNMLDEMKNVVLKKIDKVDHTQVNEKKTKITQNETNHLQLSLAMAIKQRRIEITKHEVDDSFEQSDEWSD
jgi:GTP-binding protein EngB required for normal cell division